MKVLDLQCQQGHVFEGWFGSEADFQDQKQRALVQCPLCADTHIQKRLSAPRLNLGAAAPNQLLPGPGSGGPVDGRAVAATGSAGGASGVEAPEPALPAELQAAWIAMARKIVANTEDVGAGFAQEARRIHYGDAPERAIRGQATQSETLQLLEEGIAVLPLVLPEAAKETLQ